MSDFLGEFSKNLNTTFLMFSANFLVDPKCLSDWQTVKALIRLLHQEQFDLGLHCLSWPPFQVTGVQNFRTFHLNEGLVQTNGAELD